MTTSPALQRRIDQFAASLGQEFGEIGQGEHDCLLSAIEDFGVQVGDAVTKTLAEVRTAHEIQETEEALCPCCRVRANQEESVSGS